MTVEAPVQPGIQVPADSRFARMLVAGNPLDQLQAASQQTERVAVRVAQGWSERRLGYHGVVRNDDQYELQVTFSDDDGISYGDPLVGVEGNRTYHYRVTVAQLQAYPLLKAFSLVWLLPSGWSFLDQLPATLHEEAVSNPLIVTRTILSPVNPQPAAFEVYVFEVFR